MTGRVVPNEANLFIVDLEIDVDGLAIVELTHRLGVALAPVILRIHLVIDIGRKRREPISSVLADDVGLYGTSPGIGQINDRVRKRGVLVIDDSPSQKSGIVVFLVEGRTGSRRKPDQQQHHRDDQGPLHKSPADTLPLLF